ncbi:MAG: carbamate kinase [Planctomycetota bacterium]
MRRIIMTALGGNALIRAGESASIKGQFKNARRALRALLPLFKEGAAMCLTHGNGPQVGNILIRSEHSIGKAYIIPLEVAVGQSEGEIGYLLQQSVVNLLAKEGIQRDVVGLLTQVEVDTADPAFRDPVKPVGPYLSVEDAEFLREQGLQVREEKGKGFRRVVASPAPIRILESRVVADLVHRGVVVIAAGGGGIPVARKRGRYQGVAAVVDKDRAAGMLARELRADMLLLLTGVDNVMLDYGTKHQKNIREFSVSEAIRWLGEGQFPRGSMGPKIEASIEFLTNGGKEVLITSPEKLSRAMAGEAGTRIVP